MELSSLMMQCLAERGSASQDWQGSEDSHPTSRERHCWSPSIPPFLNRLRLSSGGIADCLSRRVVCGFAGLQWGTPPEPKSVARLPKSQLLRHAARPHGPAELHQTSGAVSSVTYYLHSLNFGDQTKRQTKRQPKHLSVMGFGYGPWGKKLLRSRLSGMSGPGIRCTPESRAVQDADRRDVVGGLSEDGDGGVMSDDSMNGGGGGVKRGRREECADGEPPSHPY